MALWQPTDLGAALIAWWSADGLADGAVTTWTDSVGGLAPTQGTAARRPVRAATSFNSSYPGVTFDGTDDRLRVTSNGSLPTAASSDIYAAVSQALPGSTSGTIAIFSYGGGTDGDRALQRLAVSSVSRFRAAINVTTGGVADTAFVFDGAHIVGGQFDDVANTVTLWFDGKATTPASGSLTITTGTGSTAIGATSAGSGAFWSGVIRHIFVTTPLSTENRQKLEGWMAWDANLVSLLDAGHPYKSAAPEGAITGSLAAVETGADTAAFTGSVEAGDITGTLAAVETGTDAAAIAGAVIVAGSVAATEAGEDAAAISAGVLVSGTLAAAEVGSDSAAMIGGIVIVGSLAAVEVGADVALFVLAHREIEANKTLAGSRVITTSLQGQRSGLTELRGRM